MPSDYLADARALYEAVRFHLEPAWGVAGVFAPSKQDLDQMLGLANLGIALHARDYYAQRDKVHDDLNRQHMTEMTKLGEKANIAEQANRMGVELLKSMGIKVPVQVDVLDDDQVAQDPRAEKEHPQGA